MPAVRDAAAVPLARVRSIPAVASVAAVAAVATISACASPPNTAPVDDRASGRSIDDAGGRSAAAIAEQTGPEPGVPSPVRMRFVATAPEFEEAVAAYERIWEAEGARIVEVMERRSGVSFVKPAFADTLITANVLEAPSYSGFEEEPMRLRASYAEPVKRGTLVHELGHRLQGRAIPREAPEHRSLYLWLYDTWVELWGQEFADAQVAFERGLTERYVRAWDETLALSKEERAAKWQALLEDGAG